MQDVLRIFNIIFCKNFVRRFLYLVKWYCVFCRTADQYSKRKTAVHGHLYIHEFFWSDLINVLCFKSLRTWSRTFLESKIAHGSEENPVNVPFIERHILGGNVLIRLLYYSTVRNIHFEGYPEYAELWWYYKNDLKRRFGACWSVQGLFPCL